MTQMVYIAELAIWSVRIGLSIGMVHVHYDNCCEQRNHDRYHTCAQPRSLIKFFHFLAWFVAPRRTYNLTSMDDSNSFLSKSEILELPMSRTLMVPKLFGKLTFNYS